MKIAVYCQHVVGIGHLCRMLQIIRSLSRHEVSLILGGPPVSLSLPPHVRVFKLPGLMMDPEYTRMFPGDPERTPEETRQMRTDMLRGLVREDRPDVLLVELYPFGRGGFHFELAPLLHAVRKDVQAPCPVVCSLRDILVEKKDPRQYEQRVLDRLKPFDAVLVHSDPDVIRLEDTFSRAADIPVPVVYTGYVCEKASEKEKAGVRAILQPEPGEKLVTVSAGGGSFGYRLLDAAVQAYSHPPTTTGKIRTKSPWHRTRSRSVSRSPFTAISLMRPAMLRCSSRWFTVAPAGSSMVASPRASGGR